MKKGKKLLALVMALALTASLAACNANPAPSTTPGNSDPVTTADPVETAQTAQVGGEIQPEELGSGTPKWTKEAAADGWVKVTNDGGTTLGYSETSGVTLIQVDGYAFKDLNRNGMLDTYEDWRADAAIRAEDLAADMSGEEIAPYLTHGGWGTFTTDKSSFTGADNKGYAYITGGGRGGVTRNAGSDTQANVDHATWSNLIQETCESLDYGIPAVISIDPNGQSGIVQTLSLAATMDPDIAFEVGKAYSKQYRAMGISMLLGPQIDLMTSPVMDRGAGTYGEDPALTRDIAEAFVSGMQSTYDASGKDLGWGAESVITDMKHYAGAGASEGGRDDHSATGKYAVFPNNNYEAHLVAFHDGAFTLKRSSTGAAGGIMTNYSVAYSTDGSLGDLVAGAWSEFKYDTLAAAGWDGYIISDWGVFGDGGQTWGMEDYTVAERVAAAIKLGMNQIGGFSDLEVMAEAWDILVDDLGEEDALTLVRARAAKNIKMTMNLGLFENPYNSTETVRETNCTTESLAYGLETQLSSIVMLKNDGTIKASEGGEKQTVYIPYKFTAASAGWGRATPASWAPGADLEVAEKYFNVVTDAVGEPSGKDEEGKAAYTEKDVVRASAAEVAVCDLVLVSMDAPDTRSTATTDEEENITGWLPASIQYGEYTATTAKEASVAGDKSVEQFNDGYTVQTKESVENRSYKGQTAPKAKNYADLETLQYVVKIAGDAKIIVLMDQAGSGAMVWGEVEPLANVILNGYKVGDEAMLMTAAGLHEPSGLLVAQMPASMEAVEAQGGDDLPRDLECYVDADGNTYDFAYGLNWSGVIDDQRVKTYSADPLTKCESFTFSYAK